MSFPMRILRLTPYASDIHSARSAAINPPPPTLYAIPLACTLTIFQASAAVPSTTFAVAHPPWAQTEVSNTEPGFVAGGWSAACDDPDAMIPWRIVGGSLAGHAYEGMHCRSKERGVMVAREMMLYLNDMYHGRTNLTPQSAPSNIANPSHLEPFTFSRASAWLSSLVTS